MKLNKELNFPDFKTERKNVSNGLPASYRIIPILFYLSVIALVGSYIYIFLIKKSVDKELSSLAIRENKLKAEINKEKKIIYEIKNKKDKALAISEWVKNLKSVQPIVQSVLNEISKLGRNSKVKKIQVTRHPNIQENLILNLTLENVNREKLEVVFRNLREKANVEARVINIKEKKPKVNISGKVPTLLEYKGTIVYLY